MQTYVPSPISRHHPVSLLQSAKPTSMHYLFKTYTGMQSKKLTSQDSNKPCTVIGEASCFVNEIPTVIGKEFPAISSVRILTEKEIPPEFLKILI